MQVSIHGPLPRPDRLSPRGRPLRLGVVALAAVLASGCSVLQEDKIDYKSAQRGNALEVPPDLSQLSRDSRYALPGASVSASSQQAAQAAPLPATTAPVALGDVRIERAGSQRWLVVNRPADALWTPVTDFWRESGFSLQLEQEKLGIMETDWAENRAKLPQDFIRSALGKVFDSLYSTSERDRFRTRLERNAAGGTDIFISHRGLVEVYSTAQKDQTVWQPRPADAELEAEFLRRLMLRLGASEAQSKAAVAAVPAPTGVKVGSVNGQPAVQLPEDFDRAWRRVGLALDRNSFTVEDRDRSQGLYFVRYVPTSVAQAQKPGLLTRLFSGDSQPDAGPAQYRVKVQSSGDSSTVSVQNAQGAPDTTASAQRILELLAADLN